MPQWNANIKASFYGITAENNKNDLVTAAFKSIVYQLKDIVMIIKKDGYDISSLSIDGGMSNNRKFCQMISDILGLEILVPENVESTATGAAIVSSIRDVKQDLKDLPGLIEKTLLHDNDIQAISSTFNEAKGCMFLG